MAISHSGIDYCYGDLYEKSIKTLLISRCLMITLLYVDDEPDLLNVAKVFFEDTADFKVDTACSVAESVVKMKEVHYDAIISDYQMPGMDGIEFLKYVRAESDIPFRTFYREREGRNCY